MKQYIMFVCLLYNIWCTCFTYCNKQSLIKQATWCTFHIKSNILVVFCITYVLNKVNAYKAVYNGCIRYIDTYFFWSKTWSYIFFSVIVVWIYLQYHFFYLHKFILFLFIPVLNQTMNKLESCINQTSNKVPM